ncbi:AEC family transporter [Williamsoniiplasma lucivorax]|uniref:Malate permease n=1 Tax=Williamsoniiplasma lucivorax TaxID=209274 RepID=A0A2S5RFI2_9MOLU|nr:AEC family transporter [Williamsoniiplasma lucivorax]PPE06060.1 malate permease [Williamsoniiplasma lucivorax]
MNFYSEITTSGQAIGNALSSLLFWGTILAATFVIGLGWFIQKKKIFKEGWEQPLVKTLVMIGLPALIFNSFMKDISTEHIVNMLMLMLAGVIFFFAMSVGAKYLYINKSKSIQDTLSMCIAFGSTIYFGVPIVKAVFPNNIPDVEQAANMFNVGFWLFMCSWALFVIKKPVAGMGLDGNKLKAKDTNGQVVALENYKVKWTDIKGVILTPIIISLIAGFTLWILQLIPGIKVIHVTGSGWNTLAGIKDGYYSVTRLDALIPGLAMILNLLGALPTPLAWLAVGAIIGKTNFKEAIQNKLVWWTVVLRNLLTPIVSFVIIIIFAAIGHASGGFSINRIDFVVAVMMAASPIATTIVSYAILYNKEKELASLSTSLSTVSAAVTMPLWTIIAVFSAYEFGFVAAI